MADEIPTDRFPKLKPVFDSLEKQKKLFVDESYKLITVEGYPLYEMDFFVLAIFKRSIDLIDGVIALINNWNFSASAPLLRLHIDSLLRLNYMIQHEPKRDVVVHEWMEGKRFDKIKGSQNQPLRDIVLRELAEKDYPWIKPVYEETSAMVHLSSKHFMSLIRSVDKESRQASISVQTGVPDWPEKEILSFLEAMRHTGVCIMELASAWIEHKKTMKQ